MKGSHYKFTNQHGQWVIVLCTEDPTTATCFAGEVVACDKLGLEGYADWEVGDQSKDWLQEGFILC